MTDEAPGGPLYHQFSNEVKFYYGPYTKDGQDSVKKCSVELLIDGTSSQGERREEASLIGQYPGKVLFKERSIKYGTDYRVGDTNFDVYYDLVTVNRHNQEGYDHINHAAGNSVSNTISVTQQDYNKIILVADFVEPYLYGEFEVKDIAGSEN